jgi:hypothetical protein
MIYANRRASGLIPPTNIQPLMKSLQSWRSGSSAESRICNFIWKCGGLPTRRYDGWEFCTDFSMCFR